MFVEGETLEIGSGKVTQQVRAQREEYVNPARKLDDLPCTCIAPITEYLTLAQFTYLGGFDPGIIGFHLLLKP